MTRAGFDERSRPHAHPNGATMDPALISLSTAILVSTKVNNILHAIQSTTVDGRYSAAISFDEVGSPDRGSFLQESWSGV